MSKLRELTRTWLRWAAEMEDKHGQPIAAGLAADMGFIEQERAMSDKLSINDYNPSDFASDEEYRVWKRRAVATLEQRVERLEAERVYLFDIASVTMSAAKMLEEMEALAANEEDSTTPQQHPDNGGVT